MRRIEENLYEREGKMYRRVKSTERADDGPGYKTCCLCAFGDGDRYPAGCKGDYSVNRKCVEMNNSTSRIRDYGYFAEVK